MHLSLPLLLILTISFLSACGDSGNNATANIQANRAGEQSQNSNLSRVMNQGQAITFSLAAITHQTDASVTIAAPPNHGQVLLNNGNFSVYLPDPAYTGTDEFTYKITFANGDNEFYKVSLTILKVKPTPVKITSTAVAIWKGNAKAAYSIIHDDLCSGPFDQSGLVAHWRELKNRGLTAGFGAITSACEYEPEYYDAIHEMEANGMEIINHSFTHPGPDNGFDRALLTPGVNWHHELNESDATLRARGVKNITFFAFPYDLVNDDLLREVQAMGYLGARGGRPKSINDKQLSALDELAPFRANFDCFNANEPNESPCSRHTGTAVEILNQYVDDAIDNKGWALRELHGIGIDDSWGWVSLHDYRQHLDYVVTRVATGDLWMDTPSNVIRYQASRTYCGNPSVKNKVKIDFDNPVAINSCIKYATPLDVIATIDNADEITATQDGKTIPVKPLDGNRFLLTISPAGGETTVTKTAN